jgi:predicted AAA+ superfamily ATPase
MIFQKRVDFLSKINFNFTVNSVVALLGPRQCGKTTLARQYVKEQAEKVHYFDLEDPEDLAILQAPKLALSGLKGLIVMDEVQKLPEIFPLIRVLVDADSEKRFLILGSASKELIHQSSETLAGRISYIEITPFSYSEVEDLQRLWLRGGFPKAYLPPTLDQSVAWRKEYISAFLERDIPNLGINIPPLALRKFWMMLTAYHGNLFNASELGRSLGFSGPTIKRYLDILTGTFMIRQLQPWFENITKRQVKSPKIYFRDTGILHTLLSIGKQEELLKNPKLGASWEGFALESIIRVHQLTHEECFFWAIHEQAELDLICKIHGNSIGFEFKWADAPKLTKSVLTACSILNLHHCFIIYPGAKSFSLHEKVSVIGLQEYLDKQHLG